MLGGIVVERVIIIVYGGKDNDVNTQVNSVLFALKNWVE
jgi:hypothetical protein